MKLSHSKMSCILSCPATYFLKYVEGIYKKEEKPALAIGSAVHWGIEHNTEDLTDYFNSAEDAFTREQLLSEAMVHGYMKHKDELFEEILKDPETGEKLTLVDETHELYVNAELKSFKYDEPHIFVGIIDLLLLTNKGFIIVDYKTSTYEPEWDNYLDQIYRYVYMLRKTFPDVPIVKIGIINIRKTGIRQKKTENYSQFLNRMKFEYDLNDEHYVNYHEFAMTALDPIHIDNYIANMSKMADASQALTESKNWFINFGAANGTYGKSEFWDIFYHTKDAYLLYKISDKTFNPDTNTFDEYRDCVQLDMDVLDHDNILNKYDTFKEVVNSHEDWFDYIHKNYIVDDTLISKYQLTLEHELAESKC